MSDLSLYKALNVEEFGPDFPISDEENAILQHIDEMWSEARQAKESRKRILDEAYRQFRSIANAQITSTRDVERWGMAIFVPVTFQVVMGIQAQLNGRPPQFRQSPLFVPKDRRVTDAVSKFTVAEFKRSEAMRAFVTGTQLSLIFGTAFLRSVYKNDVREVDVVTNFSRNAEGEADETTMVIKKEEKTFYKGWGLEVDHPLRVYLPLVREKDPQKWPFYIVRDIVDVEERKKFYEKNVKLAYKQNYKGIKPGGNLDDDLAVYDEVDPAYRGKDPRYPGSISDVTSGSAPLSSQSRLINPKNKAERLRIFDQTKDRWTEVIAGRVVSHYPNPSTSKKLPVVAMRDYTVEFDPWGIGEPQLIHYLQLERNALHTFALDGTKYATNGVFALNSTALKDPNDLSVYPGKIFEMKNLPGVTIDSVIQSFNMPDVKNSVFKMLDMNDSMVSRVTGAGTSIIGGDPINTGGSATESNNLKAAATTRVYERARAIEQENLVDVVNMLVESVADFYDDKTIAKVSENEFIKFVPGEESDYSVEDKATDIADGYKAIIYTSDFVQGFQTITEGESTLPISRQERRIEAMQLQKLALDARRPPTQEELATDPAIMQKYPQGVPIYDAESIAEKLVLPTFSVISDPQEFLWNGDLTEDRKRGVGRPADPTNMSELNALGNEANSAAQLAAPQPMEQGINDMERINQGPQMM